MVDSIGNNGGVPPVQNNNRPQARGNAGAVNNAGAAPVDEVSISAEAAELLANDTRTIIEQRIDAALSGGRDVRALL